MTRAQAIGPRDRRLQGRFTMNTADYLLNRGLEADTAVIDAFGSWTYAELRAASARIAGALDSMGAAPGSRVGIIGPNSLFWIASYLAVLKIGCVAVPFSIVATAEDVGRNAAWAGCSFVCMDRKQQRAFGAVFPASIGILLDDAIQAGGPSLWPETPVGFDPASDAVLMFTSGTTSAPKAVRVTHTNIQANTDSIVEYLGLRSHDRMLVILPFFYCFGTSLLHTHLHVGGSVVLCNNFTFPESALDMMEKNRCTGFAGVPSSYQLLLRISTFRARPLPDLRLLQQAGGKLHNVLLEELVASKPNASVFVMYGQTEATARLSYLPPSELPRKLGSIGKGIPGVELRVLSEDGKPVSPGQVGEIWAKGRNISPGYYRDPEGSAGKFVDGELRTGDLATVDEDGYIYVVDRKDDFIKSWGHRISSQDVESCVLRIPEVVSAAAVGVPDPDAGESIRVFITVRPGAELDPAVVLDHCRKTLAKHMVPSGIEIIKKLPLNSNGKVVKAELRRIAEK